MKKTALAGGVAFLAVAFFVSSIAAQTDIPTTIQGGILNGKAVSLPIPTYPAEAKAAGVEGTVYVDLEISETGSVVSAVAQTQTVKRKEKVCDAFVEVDVEPADPILRAEAEKAALAARFSPTLLNGTPVKVRGQVVYRFVVSDVVSGKPGCESDEASKAFKSQALDVPTPTYPAAARAVRAQGWVSVRVVVNTDGDVVSAEAVSGHPLLRDAAVSAARSAKFQTQAGQIAGVLTYNFVLPADSN